MSMAPQTERRAGGELEAHAQRHGVHPGPRQYVAIAVVLAIVTGLEVLVYYWDKSNSVMVPIFIVLALTKFTMVALWFMHLKFDSRLFSAVFVFGLLLAVSVFVVFLSLVRVFFA
jgi:cytochrome c oxidase subunit 4